MSLAAPGSWTQRAPYQEVQWRHQRLAIWGHYRRWCFKSTLDTSGQKVGKNCAFLRNFGKFKLMA